MYGAGELASWLFEADTDSRRAALARSKPYLLTAAACALASLINPYFYKLHVHIFQYLTDSYHFEHISEFQSISFHHPAAHYLEPMLGLGMVAAAWNLYQRRFAYVLILGGFAHLGLMSARNIPVFVLLAAPLIAATVHELLALIPERSIAAWMKRTAAAFHSFGAEVAENDAIGRIPLASAVAGALVVAMLLSLPSVLNAAGRIRSETLSGESRRGVCAPPSWLEAFLRTMSGAIT